MLLTGQRTLTASAQQLTESPQAPGAEAYVFKAASSNAGNVYVGDSTVTTSTGYSVEPGETLEMTKQLSIGKAIFNIPLSSLYVVGATGDVVSWVASVG